MSQENYNFKYHHIRVEKQNLLNKARDLLSVASQCDDRQLVEDILKRAQWFLGEIDNVEMHWDFFEKKEKDKW